MSGERALPGLGLTGFWSPKSSGWNDGMDENLRRLSVLVQPRAKSRVTALPSSPTQGDVYVVPSAGGANANAIAAYDAGSWHYLTPLEGFEIYVVDEHKSYRFTGTAWTTDAGGGIEDAPQDGKQYARQDGAWSEVVAGSGGPGGISGGHAWWRVLCTGDNGNGVGLAEVQFRPVAGSAQIPTGGTAISANDLGGGYSRESAFDGNGSTFWASSSTNNGTIETYIGYHFADPVNVKELALTKRPAGFGDNVPTTFKVQWSDDGAAWTTAGSEVNAGDISDGGGWPSGTTKTFAVST